MSFFYRCNTDKSSLRDTGSGNFINRSGIYSVVIKKLIYSKSPNGSESLDMWIDNDGTTQVLYGAVRLTNNDGTPNFQSNLLSKLMVICLDAQDGMELADPVTETLPIGKNGDNKECQVLKEFDEQPVTLRIQMEYGIYDGKIQERRILRNVFRVPDGASASEIVNEAESYVQLEEERKEADLNMYKDDLTEEDVKAWIRGGRNKDKVVTPKNEPRRSFTKRTAKLDGGDVPNAPF